ncbi:MAG TPA: DMT family transporter [Nitrososphaerales archaeon]|nr:DMT family transporter [Nitrososphaerales archaeon]
MSGGSVAGETSKGYIYAVAGAVCGGSITVLTKILLERNGPVSVTGLSFIISGFMLLSYRPGLKPPKASVPYLLFMGLVGACLSPLMYTFGLSETTAVNAALLANGEVLFTTIIAYSVFGERLVRAQALRGLLIVAGLVVVSTNLDITHISFLQGIVGNMLVLGSTVGWAVENNLLAVATRRFDVPSLSKFRNLIGGAVVMAVVVLGGFTFDFTYYDDFVLVLLAAAITGGVVLFIAAIKRLGAIRMLLIWSTSSVFGAVFAFLFLGEQITPGQLTGGALIMLGVYLFRRSERQIPPA